MSRIQNFYLLKFAWKSIKRNAGRSFFIGFSVSLAVVIAVWVNAFFDGMNNQIEEAVVNTNTGYFQLQEAHYAYSTDSSNPREFQKQLVLPGLKFSPELVLDGNIATPEGSAGLLVLGIVPEFHRDFLPLGKNITEGHFLDSVAEDTVVIGQELAELFKFHTGDQLVLNYQDQSGELRSEILTIGGIYHFNSKSFEKRFVYTNQRTWQKLFLNQDTGKILFNRIGLMAPNLTDYGPPLKEKARANGLKLKTWKNLNPEMAVVLDFHDGMIKFFFLIIAVTITMTILTPVRMLWQERIRELKMMNVLGVTPRRFWKIGAYEIFLMILLSACASSVLLSLVIGVQSKYGIDLRGLNDGVTIERAGIKIPGIIYPALSLHHIVLTFFFVVFILGASYLWSIHRTLKTIGGGHE
jgi:ABC-type lipoprotein release transport system permease subunit